MNPKYTHNHQLPLARKYEDLIFREEVRAREKIMAAQCRQSPSKAKKKSAAAGDSSKAGPVVYIATVMQKNPGSGSYAVTITTPDGKIENAARLDELTEPRLELEAMTAALRVLKGHPGAGTVKTTTKWIVDFVNNGQAHTWRTNGWRKSGGKPIHHQDLWAELLSLFEQVQPTLTWVARSADPQLKRCLTLAQEALQPRKAGAQRRKPSAKPSRPSSKVATANQP